MEITIKNETWSLDYKTHDAVSTMSLPLSFSACVGWGAHACVRVHVCFHSLKTEMPFTCDSYFLCGLEQYLHLKNIFINKSRKVLF